MYLKNFKKKNIGPKILYLDQNIWIYLARIHYKKEYNETFSQIKNKLFEMVSSGKLIIPINLTNIIETQKITDLNRRERLVRFIISLSKGYSFIPDFYILYKEVENLVLERLGRPLHNIRESSIGKGVLYMISDGTPYFAPKFHTSSIRLIDDTKDLLAKVIMKKQSEQEEAIFNFMMKSGGNDDLEDLIEKLEEIRSIGYETKDKKLRKIKGIANFFINMVAPRLYYACQNNNFDPKTFRLNKEETIYDILKSLPWFYTQYLLFRGLDEMPNRKITSNDIYDIRSFSFAIPYWDYIVGENYIIALAKRNNLDNLYCTKLYIKSDFVKIKLELDKLRD